jgi:hypothetical protein
VKRVALFLLLAIFPATAHAQSSHGGSNAPDGGSDTDAVAAEIDSDWAQAQSSDCDTACRALDSMRRATERLCAMDPGDRCARARQKLAEATAHVRSACPSCPEATGHMFTESEKAEAPPAPAPAGNAAVAEETVQKKSGGCGGCTLATADDGSPGAAWLLGLALLLLRKGRVAGRRDDLGARARERRAS